LIISLRPGAEKVTIDLNSFDPENVGIENDFQIELLESF